MEGYAVTGYVEPLHAAGPAATPAWIRATAADGSVAVTWQVDPGANRYVLFWATASGVTRASTMIDDVTSGYTHTGRSNGTEYYYRVAASEGRLSREAMAAPRAPISAVVDDRIT